MFIDAVKAAADPWHWAESLKDETWSNVQLFNTDTSDSLLWIWLSRQVLQVLSLEIRRNCLGNAPVIRREVARPHVKCVLRAGVKSRVDDWHSACQEGCTWWSVSHQGKPTGEEKPGQEIFLLCMTWGMRSTLRFWFSLEMIVLWVFIWSHLNASSYYVVKY